MTSASNDQKISTEQPVKGDQQQRLPNERDESPEGHTAAPHDVMKQAASDIERGLVDTDLHGTPGVEKVKPSAPQQAAPVAPGGNKTSH
jgi:hypothetical protein